MATPVIAAIITVAKAVLATKIIQRVIAAVAISALSRSLQPKSKASAIDRSSRLTKRRDPSPFREAILGTGATAGSFVDGVAYGPDQMMYLEIIRLADHECDGLVSVISGGKTLTINGDGSVQEYVESGTPRMWIWFEAGSWNATAHSEVITAFGGRYSANDRGRGICRAVVKCDMRSEKLFPGRSVPDLRFVIRGARIYIPRLDVSLGGSHQWGNYATYQWTDNLADIAYNVARGIYQYGGSTPDFVAGGSYEAEELPLAHYAAEGAACATQIALKGGGSEARYRGGIIIQDDDQLEDALIDLAAGAGGFMLERGGSLLFHAGIARTPVATLTDKDFIQGKTARTWRVRARERFNVVSGKFTDPSLRYEVGPLPERRSPSDIASDNGEERVDTLSLGVVQSGTQGQRVMEIRRRLNRRSGLFTAQLPPAWQHLEAGDWINYTSAKRGWTKTFVIMPLELQTGQEDMLANNVTLVEVSANDFTWNPATDQLDVTNPAPVGPGVVPDGSVAGFAASAATLVNDDESAPGLNVSWTPPTDPTVVQVAVEYQRLGASTWTRQSEVATTGGAQVTGLSGGIWRVRLVPITKPLRPVVATSVIQVTLGKIVAGGAVAGPDGEPILNQDVPIGVNQIINSDLNQGLTGFFNVGVSDLSGTGFGISSGRNFSTGAINFFGVRNAFWSKAFVSAGALAGQYMYGYGSNGHGGNVALLNRYGVRVKAGQRIFVNAGISVHGFASAGVELSFWDSAGNWVVTPIKNQRTIGDARSGGPQGTNGDPANYAFFPTFYTVPAGAAYATMAIFGYNLSPSQADAYVFGIDFYLGLVAQDQVAVPEYNPGPTDRAADKTSDNTPSIRGPTAITLDVTSGGALYPPSQLPVTRQWQRFRGEVDVSALTTWSIVSPINSTWSAISNGVSNLTAIAAGKSSAIIRSEFEGVTLDRTVEIIKNTIDLGDPFQIAFSDTEFLATGSTATLTTNSVTATITGGVGPYLYAWRIASQDNENVTNLRALTPTSATTALRAAVPASESVAGLAELLVVDTGSGKSMSGYLPYQLVRT